MNVEILSFVEKMEAAVLNDLVTTDASDLYEIALDMITEDKESYVNICQAYEVVKHNLVG
ncbi:hypothetical protein NSQ62_07155 [Solibacillus sp. FSL H8-0523]|uniref:hypothetical protein n=1 Tax=Solibacillus sp. FSL H8-0523 TaxID=2954511 RepID=UPI003100D627